MTAEAEVANLYGNLAGAVATSVYSNNENLPRSERHVEVEEGERAKTANETFEKE